jgi:hypothetical protein
MMSAETCEWKRWLHDAMAFMGWVPAPFLEHVHAVETAGLEPSILRYGFCRSLEICGMLPSGFMKTMRKER